MGDWSEGNNFMKKKEPTINKRIRYLLRTDKYNVYMINEFRTSKLCNKCEIELVKDYKRNKLDKYPVWGLVCCKNKNCVQELIQKNPNLSEKRTNNITRYMNRDKNSVLNMIKIVESLKITNKRPTNYCKNY